MNLNLKPVDMTEEVMADLEKRGLIIRLKPGAHAFPAPKGKSLVTNLYVSDAKYGPHKTISVVVDHNEFSAFGTHSDNEEFLLLGGINERPMYLLVSYITTEAIEQKIADKTISADDFVCLRCKHNDPYVSFFTMLKGVPHGEAAAEGEGSSPSFYVTEPADIDMNVIDFKEFCLNVVE